MVSTFPGYKALYSIHIILPYYAKWCTNTFIGYGDIMCLLKVYKTYVITFIWNDLNIKYVKHVC